MGLIAGRLIGGDDLGAPPCRRGDSAREAERLGGVRRRTHQRIHQLLARRQDAGRASPSGRRGCSSRLTRAPGDIAVIRVRSGFVQNVLGFNLTREVAPGYRLVRPVRAVGRRFERAQAGARPAARRRGTRGLPQARGAVGNDTGGARARPLRPRGDPHGCRDRPRQRPGQPVLDPQHLGRRLRLRRTRRSVSCVQRGFPLQHAVACRDSAHARALRSSA